MLKCEICGHVSNISLTKHMSMKHGIQSSVRKNGRYSVVSFVCKEVSAKSYLEIGVRKGHTFSKVKADRKVAVDPDPNSAATIFQTSDAFFSDYSGEPFDVIFVDGMHEKDFVFRDILNSENILNPGGVIIVDDCAPADAITSNPVRKSSIWCGDVWSGWIQARKVLASKGYKTFTVDAAMGMGIAFKVSDSPVELDLPENPSQEEFLKNREALLSLVSFEAFKSEILAWKR